MMSNIALIAMQALGRDRELAELTLGSCIKGGVSPMGDRLLKGQKEAQSCQIINQSVHQSSHPSRHLPICL